MTLAFIPFTFSESARLVEHILDCGGKRAHLAADIK
jgi:hypothetical protein